MTVDGPPHSVQKGPLQLYLAAAARKEHSPYHPRHFITLTNFFAPERARWTTDLASMIPNQWLLVIRAPGAFSLSREASETRGRTETVFDRITPIERIALEGAKGRLLIDLGWEILFPYDDVIAGLAQAIAEFQIHPKRVHILHGNYDIDAALSEKWAAATGAPRYTDIVFPVGPALAAIHQQKDRNDQAIGARLQAAKQSLRPHAKPKRYNFFNGEPRPHRLLMLCRLAALGLLDAGHISMLGYSKGGKFGGHDTEAQRTHEAQRFRSFARKAQASGSDIDMIEQVLESLPLQLDIEAGKVRESVKSLEAVAWTSQDPKYYDETWFSIVADTLFYDKNVRLVSEKALKPIMNAAPLIYFGNPGGLSHLRDWGFEFPTAGLFSAAHDAIADGPQRMEAALAVAAAAASAPEMDVREAAHAVWPMCEHNYRHFFSDYPQRLATRFNADVLDLIEAMD